MPQQLVRNAASLYLQLTEISLRSGLISQDEWYKRLGFLATHGEGQFRDLRDHINPRYLEHDELDDQSEWSVMTESDLENIEPGIGAEGGRGIFIPPPDPIICRFLSSSIPGASGATSRVWRFHEADPDFFPSIPHGHAVQNQDKLDVYRGSIFRGDHPIGKEPRRLLVVLWNDSKFRDYARRVILWYQTVYPNFVWPVPHPQRLPRRKRF